MNFSNNNNNSLKLKNERLNETILEVAEKNSDAKIWSCVLTSIIQFSELDYKEDISLNNFHEYLNETRTIELEQFLFDQMSKKNYLIRVRSDNEKKSNSLETKRKNFLERSLKNQNKINLDVKFKITEHCYSLFNYLRKLNNISNSTLKKSFDLDINFEKNIKNSYEMQSKSKSTFFFTYDNKMIIKSINFNDMSSFSKNLKKYFFYMIKNNERTLINRILGFYTLELEKTNKIHFILIENVLEKISNKCHLLRLYDLKGSSRYNKDFPLEFKEQKIILNDIFDNKITKKKLLEAKKNKNFEKIKIVRGKDCDLKESEDDKIEINENDKELILFQLEEDTNFLESCNFMDYSLIFSVGLKSNFEYKSKKKFFFEKFRLYKKDDYIYLNFSIIDFLTSYSLGKRLETQFKSLVYDASEISCVDPNSYKKRFLNYIKLFISKK